MKWTQLKWTALSMLVLGITTGVASHAADVAPRVFEIRTYTTAPGKLQDLHRRFREHTLKLFERHGMTNIAYWTPQDPELASLLDDLPRDLELPVAAVPRAVPRGRVGRAQAP